MEGWVLLHVDPCGSIDDTAMKPALGVELYNIHFISEMLVTKSVKNSINTKWNIFGYIVRYDSNKTQV